MRLIPCLLLPTLMLAAESPTFAKDVGPLLTKRCTECHGEKKAKGGLRLDSLEATLKGGKEGPVVVPGQGLKSELYEVVTKPEGDADIMPPKGKPLTSEQAALIRAWIDAGAK